VAEAKAALQNAVGDLRNGLASSADLRAWVRRYPWAAVGAAAVTGFAAATAITPAPGESLQEKLSKIGANGDLHAKESAPVSIKSAAGTNSVLSDKLLSSFVDLAKTAVQTVILATLRSEPPTQQDVAGPDAWQTRMAK
jgi:hypothetical protein